MVEYSTNCVMCENLFVAYRLCHVCLMSHVHVVWNSDSECISNIHFKIDPLFSHIPDNNTSDLHYFYLQPSTWLCTGYYVCMCLQKNMYRIKALLVNWLVTAERYTICILNLSFLFFFSVSNLKIYFNRTEMFLPL